MLKLWVLAVALLAAASASTADYDDENPELTWPEGKYKVEAKKYTINAGLDEDIQYWKSGKNYRVDYNNGAVKEIKIATSSRRSAKKYNVHPEVNGDEPVVVCRESSTRATATKSILPDTEGFEKIGEEEIHGQQAVKFYLEDYDGESVYTQYTLWAKYNASINAYVPLKLEKLEGNYWMGNYQAHEVSEFYNFDTEFNDEEVFDIESICPDDAQKVSYKKNHKTVPKHIQPSSSNHHGLNHLLKHFKKHFNKKYENNAEHKMRKNILNQNMKLVKETNRKNLGYQLSLNQFSDRTPEEMKRHMGLLRRAPGTTATHPFTYDPSTDSQALPTEFDLRDQGFVSPVINQDTCGSCWTFGTTSAVEGALARHNGGKLIHLANQALIDCSWEYGNGGCNGGTDAAAYKWMMDYGLPSVAEYGTYSNQEGFCQIKNMTKTYKIKGFVDVTPKNEQALKYAIINHGPLSVSVQVNSAFAQYAGGIFYDFSCDGDPNSLNHEVTLVGYGEDNGETFWILKNSWGQQWGIGGFMHIAAKDNMCGVMTEPTYVLF